MKKAENGKLDLSTLLENANLTPAEILDNLSSLMRSADSDTTKLRAAETGLKLNGMLSESEHKQDFQVTINIIDSEFASLNPILIPRE